LCRGVAQSVQGNAETRGLVLAHLSFVEDLDNGLEIEGRLVGQLIKPLRHGDQGGSRACVRGDARYSKTVGRGQAELFGSIRHGRTLRCANSARSNWFRLMPTARSCPEQLYELIGDKAGFEQLQSGLRNVHFGLAVETGAMGPVDPRPHSRVSARRRPALGRVHSRHRMSAAGES
jgi:hypothetical protein